MGEGRVACYPAGDALPPGPAFPSRVEACADREVVRPLVAMIQLVDVAVGGEQTMLEGGEVGAGLEELEVELG